VFSGVLLFSGVRRVKQIFFTLGIYTVSKTGLLPVAVKCKDTVFLQMAIYIFILVSVTWNRVIS